MASMRHILIATFGSLGDLHPFIALALELRSRSHLVTFCSSELYRAKIEGLNFPFYPLRPDVAPDSPEMMQWSKDIMDAQRGPERLLRDFLFPRVGEMYEDLSRAFSSSPPPDLLISSEILYAAPILAEKTKIPWASVVLSPMSFLSASDPPILPQMPRVSKFLFSFGPRINRGLINLMKRRTYPWAAPVRKLRAELGLPPGRHPIFEGKHSPDLVLAMFSRMMGLTQPDWPPNTVLTGFAFYDGTAEQHRSELDCFLRKGPSPIVFTLGSAAVFDPSNFYEESLKAVQILGQRAILLLGNNPPPENLPETVAAFDYLPFSTIFPKAELNVHQGGIGTTGQALRAGRPMLIMPYSHDQQDNAHRIEKLKVGRSISRSSYSAKRATRELSMLLEEPRYRLNANDVSAQIQKENGAKAAADALETLLDRVIPGRCTSRSKG
jgi:rhamnosyltransferase subunit B